MWDGSKMCEIHTFELQITECLKRVTISVICMQLKQLQKKKKTLA